jgi:uncharacterized protein (TIGR03382 family)
MRPAVLSFGLGLMLVASTARAHIKMSAPADWLTTNTNGDPQKIGPCGVDPTTQPGSTTYTPSNKVTTVHAGDKLMVSWTETIPHDGWFRISLALNSRDELTDPMVTETNKDGTPKAVAISSSYPVLADDLFPHMAANTANNTAYMTTVTIPADASCTKCTLQLLQFMAEHPADPSYFYHHCADLQIVGSGAAGGSNGAAGHGGAAGHAATGGSGGGSGGAAGHGTGGVGSGGVPGSGGIVASGGSPGTGGTPGTGGVPTTGTGGSSPPGTGGVTTGTGGASNEGNPGSESGCSCQSVPTAPPLLSLALAFGATLLARRRRRG